MRDHFRVRAGKAQATGGSSGHRLLLEYADDPLSNDPLSNLSDLSNPATAGSAFRVLNIIKAEVKESTWNAFWRSTIDGVPPAVVAEELQIPIPSVCQHGRAYCVERGNCSICEFLCQARSLK